MKTNLVKSQPFFDASVFCCPRAFVEAKRFIMQVSEARSWHIRFSDKMSATNLQKFYQSLGYEVAFDVLTVESRPHYDVRITNRESLQSHVRNH